MKIFFVGYHNPHFLSFCEYIERAIKELGHDLAVYDYRDWLIPGRIRDRVPALNNWDLRRINRHLIAKVKKFQPDILLVTGGWTISAETITLLKEETNAVTMNWIADFPLMFDTYMNVGPHYDYLFASGTEALARYKNAGNTNGHWLPFACDPQIHRSVNLTQEEAKKYKTDICFVGSCYSERIEILEHLTDFDIGIWGPGWDKLPAGSPLRPFIRGNSVQPQEWVKILSASKIGLNIIGHRCDVMEPFVEKEEFRMTNTKLYEILSCGIFQMVDAKADAVSLFQDKEHVCFYQDGQDLQGRVKQYLDQPEERKRISQAGQKEVHRKHTYQHRIKEILSMIQNVSGGS